MNIGEWVKHRGTSRIGLIKKKNEINECFVAWHWDKGKRITGPSVSWVGPSALVPAPVELMKEDYKALIDLALGTNDVGWLKQISRKLSTKSS